MHLYKYRCLFPPLFKSYRSSYNVGSLWDLVLTRTLKQDASKSMLAES